MRGLGYKDEDMGGVWPQSYMAEAQTNGLLKSTGITSAYAGLTRAQAAKLFLRLLKKSLLLILRVAVAQQQQHQIFPVVPHFLQGVDREPRRL